MTPLQGREKIVWDAWGLIIDKMIEIEQICAKSKLSPKNVFLEMYHIYLSENK